MVDRARAAAPASAVGAAASSPASSVAGVRRQPAEAGRRPAPPPRSTAQATWSARVARPARPQPGDPRAPATAARCRWPAPRPSGSSASTSSVIRRLSTWACAASSGASAFHALPAGSRGPDQAGHPRAVQPGAGQPRPSARRRGRATQASKASVGIQAGLPSASAPVASSPAAAATSTTSAAVGLVDVQRAGGRLEVAHAEAAAAQRARRVRCPTGPAAARRGGPPRTPRPAAARSTMRLVAVRGRRARARRRPAPAWCARRAARGPTSPGSTTTPPPRGTSSLRASSSSAGVRGVRGQHGVPRGAGGRPRRRCRRRARAARGPARTARRAAARPPPAGGGSAERGCSPLSPAAAPPPSPSATPLSGAQALRRTPRPGPGRAAARSAASTSAGVGAHERATQFGRVVWPATTRASRTESSSRVSWSRARSSEARVAAREASWPKSCGAGVARSGRSSEQAGQPLVRPAAQLVGEGAVPVGAGAAIRTSRPRYPPAAPGDDVRSCPPGRWDEPGRASARRRDRRRAGPRGQRGRLPRRAAGLRRRRRHGRPRRRGRRQRDRGRGVRAARRGGLRPAPRRRRRRRHAGGLPGAGSWQYAAAHRAARRRDFHAGTTAVVALLVEDDERPALAAGEPR